MQIFADLHIHSRYARATSKDMNLDNLDKYAALKGLNLVGTGDFTHPLWLKELKAGLKEISEGIFCHTSNKVSYILTTEVSNVFEQDGTVHKIHNLLIMPSFEIAEQANEFLSKFGDLKADGRPTLSATCAQMVEGLMQISHEIEVVSAHAWTPWYSLFGSKSGFNSFKECYQEQAKNVHAIETGLSSNPAMNWRLSQLDDVSIISNSDCHSFYPWRLGRECNVVALEKFNYKNFISSLLSLDSKKFLFTVETAPEYGKYHMDGHRLCNVCFEPKETKKLKGICPKCKRKLTIGVANRVEELADRPEGFVRKNAVPFKSLLPLSEVIAVAIGAQLGTQKVWAATMQLVEKFGNEFEVLLNAPQEKISETMNEKIAAAIMKNREGKIKIQPGYDGVYGIPLLDKEFRVKKSGQKSLSEF